MPILPVHDQLAAQKDLFDASRQRIALEQAVVHAAMLLRGSDRPGRLGIEQDDVAVRTYGNGAFPGKKAEQLSGVGRCQCHEAVERQATLSDGPVIDQWQAGFDAWSAVGDFAEVVLALLF